MIHLNIIYCNSNYSLAQSDVRAESAGVNQRVNRTGLASIVCGLFVYYKSYSTFICDSDMKDKYLKFSFRHLKRSVTQTPPHAETLLQSCLQQ